MKSGFVTLVGRPNVGKSTLLNHILGQKVTIVSDKPQTTRTQVRGVLTRPDAQIVFVDTPGIHKPRTLLGERLNDAADAAIGDVDVVCLLVDATMPIGPGDKWIAQRVPANAIVVVNKTDKAEPTQVLTQLHAAAEQLAGGNEYFPISAKTGAGVAELVREQLLAVTRDEVPHSVAARVTEWEWPRIRVEILVERDSQKGIVIGKKGAVLKQVGINVRRQLPDGAYLELFVKVDKDWQRKSRALERLGY